MPGGGGNLFGDDDDDDDDGGGGGGGNLSAGENDLSIDGENFSGVGENIPAGEPLRS